MSVEAAKWLLQALLGAIPIACVYTILFMVLAVVVIVVCQKFKVYTRRNKAWNILTKLHYGVLVLAFMSLGFALGLTASLQHAADRILDEKLQPTLSRMISPIRDHIIEALPPELVDGPMTGQAIYDHFIEQAKAEAEAAAAKGEEGLMAEMGREVEAQVKAYLMKVVIEQAVTRAGEKVGLSEQGAEFSLEAFKSIDFGQQADEIATKIADALKKQVAGFVWSLRLQFLLYFAIIMALLAIDPLIYFLICLPRQGKKHGGDSSGDDGAVEVVDVEEIQETEPA